MTMSSYTDCFVVVNGPEDGTEFPIVRTPARIGRDASCIVNVRLDNAVRSFHALVTVVSDGYRIRRTDAAPVYVNGKRAGMFRSRVIRSSGALQVGNTLLCLECAPDGLASRSHGIVSGSDLGWAAQQAIRTTFLAIRGVTRFIQALFGRLLSNWLLIGALLVLLYFLWPRFRYNVAYYLRHIYYRLQGLLPL